MKNKKPDKVTSYEFLKKHLYDKPQLYERSFQQVKPYLRLLAEFRSLKDLKGYLESELSRSFQRSLKADLKDLNKQHPELFTAIVEVLMFVLWDKLVEDYGTGERFADAYWDLISELKPAEVALDQVADIIEPGYEPDEPPPVPEENKGLWNYMGSETLSDAVEGRVLSPREAEAVMEISVYRRSYHYVAKELGITPAEVDELYQQGIIKLRKWLS